MTASNPAFVKNLNLSVAKPGGVYIGKMNVLICARSFCELGLFARIHNCCCIPGRIPGLKRPYRGDRTLVGTSLARRSPPEYY